MTNIGFHIRIAKKIQKTIKNQDVKGRKSNSSDDILISIIDTLQADSSMSEVEVAGCVVI